MGCDAPFLLRSLILVNFNPRTRVGCDATPATRKDSLAISIRAPVWGAIELSEDDKVKFLRISIRAPVWGAMLAWWREQSEDDISIRAPVWGAI